MTVYEETVNKIHKMPESLVEEVNDFVNFLLMKHNNTRWQLFNQFSEGFGMAESGFSDYLSNLEDYENRLMRGEIQW